MRSGIFSALVASVHLAILPHFLISTGDEPLDGFVVAVPEGDALTLQAGRERITVSLSDIDAPELDQPYGAQSRESLAALALGRSVRCVERGRDKLGRSASRCTAKDLDMNAEQVRRGMAWAFPRYRSDELLERLQEEARIARRGLWKEADAVPPWRWMGSRSRRSYSVTLANAWPPKPRPGTRAAPVCLSRTAMWS